MLDLNTAPGAVLLLRLSLGILFLAHGMLKVRVFTVPGTVAYFRSLGLPAWLAYVTIVMELGGGTCLILGIYARYVALVLTPLILGTIVTPHGKNGWVFSNKDGGWEFSAFWAVTLLVLFLSGDGPWALLPSPTLGTFL